MCCTLFVRICTRYVPVHKIGMYHFMQDMSLQVYTNDVQVHTWLYLSELCFTGFCGARRDANTRVPDVEQPPADLEIDESGNIRVCTPVQGASSKKKSFTCGLELNLFQATCK